MGTSRLGRRPRLLDFLSSFLTIPSHPPKEEGTVGLVTTTIGGLDRVPLDKPESRGHSRFRRAPRSDEFAARAAMHEEIHRELYRSRRYGHSFALVKISLQADWPTDHRVPRLDTFLRLIDRAWTTDGHSWLLLPEARAEDALSLLDRIRADVPALLAGRSIGLATFPESALTLEGLLAAAHGRPESTVRVDADRSQTNVAVRHNEAVS